MTWKVLPRRQGCQAIFKRNRFRRFPAQSFRRRDAREIAWHFDCKKSPAREITWHLDGWVGTPEGKPTPRKSELLHAGRLFRQLRYAP